MSKETAQDGDGLQPDLQDGHGNGLNGRELSWSVRSGNTASWRPGDRSQRSGPELFPERAGILLERERAIVTDLGGEAEVSTAKRELVTRLVQASAIADSLAVGLHRARRPDGQGPRPPFRGDDLSVLDRIHRLAHAVGLERKPKTVDLAHALTEHQR